MQILSEWMLEIVQTIVNDNGATARLRRGYVRIQQVKENLEDPHYNKTHIYCVKYLP